MQAVVFPTEKPSQVFESMARKKKDAQDAAKKTYHQTSVRIPDEDYQRLENIASRMRIDVASLIRFALRRYMAALEKLAEEAQ